MGNYHSDKRDKRKSGECIITAVEDFAGDILKAAEIEYINLVEMRMSTNIPLTFFAINMSIDKALKSIREQIPDMVPPMKEYKNRLENKKGE